MASSPFGSIALPTQLFLSFALGHAASPAIEPFAASITNDAWDKHRVRPPDVYVVAGGVAQGQIPLDQAQGWAHHQGISDDVLTALVNAANTGPGSAYAFELWRRGIIGQSGFERALKRLGLEDEWIADLDQLHDVLLSSPELAMMQQQGFIDAARANNEGSLQGVTNERQQLRFEASGLPPGIETALQMLRRSIIGPDVFAQIVREGHTKTKYTDDLAQLQDQVLSAGTYVRSYLKGHITQAQMHTGGALTGYKPADLDLWYLSEGRPATAHEIHIGYARGASLPGASNELDAIATAVKQSDIRPEYTGIIQANRFSYPSAFVLRSLAQAGDLGNAAAVSNILQEIGWRPDFADKVAAAWSGGAAAGTDPHLSKAQTQLWTTTHRSYVAEEIDNPTATTAIEAAGVTAASAPAVLALWARERTLVRKQLSPAQIRKAVHGGVTNPATGQPWTHAEGITALLARGYDQADAETLLEL